jgi:ABC-type uncharacterized transport system permease subunit
MNSFLDIGIVTASIRMGAPLLFAALGTVFISSAGVYNIAIEGSMLIGTFVAVVAGYLTHSVFFGFVAAGLGGMLLGIMLAFFIVRFRGDAIVVGIGGNIFAWGITVFLLEEVFHMRGSFSGEGVPSFPSIRIPLLDSIPVLREIVSGYSLPVYLAFFFAILVWVVLYKTPVGLVIRATGKNSEAVRSIGTNVERIQIVCFALSGFFAGLGGACLSIANLQGLWSENMTVGRGYIAICAAAFGRNNPILVILACLVFGFAEAIGIRFQVLQLEPSFVLMIPYVVTIVMLVLSSRRERV